MKKHCEKYDAYFNDKNGEWLKEKCSDKKCPYCKNRPNRHKMHTWVFIGNQRGICE